MKRYDLYDVINNGDGYERHRIPGLLITKRGTLLIYHEARRTPEDWALMDILLQRSEDHAQTVSKPIVLASGTEELPTVNNPVMMQDVNGRIHFIYCENYGVDGGRVLRRYSDDDGVTWSDIIDISEYTMPWFRNAVACGPGHGICMRDGTLVVPIWVIPKFYESPIHAHYPSMIGTFYSRDNGESWAIGDLLASNAELQCPNETSAALLSDGRVYLNIRCNNAWRARAISLDGHSGWQEYVPDKRLIDPKCFGAVASYAPVGERPMLLFANCESKTERKNVVLKGSADDGKNWQYRFVVDAERGGYVELNTDAENGNIYVLYEDRWGESLHLAVVSVSDLKGSI